MAIITLMVTLNPDISAVSLSGFTSAMLHITESEHDYREH